VSVGLHNVKVGHKLSNLLVVIYGNSSNRMVRVILFYHLIGCRHILRPRATACRSRAGLGPRVVSAPLELLASAVVHTAGCQRR